MDIIPGVKTYDPTLVSGIFGGAILQSWNSITVEVTEDRFTFTKGTTGEVTRTKNPVMMANITVNLPQTSEDNAIFSAFEVAGNTISCMVVDRGGRSIHVVPQGTFTKPATAEYGREAGEREWVITGQLKDPSIVGGN